MMLTGIWPCRFRNRIADRNERCLARTCPAAHYVRAGKCDDKSHTCEQPFIASHLRSRYLFPMMKDFLARYLWRYANPAEFMRITGPVVPVTTVLAAWLCAGRLLVESVVVAAPPLAPTL